MDLEARLKTVVQSRKEVYELYLALWVQLETASMFKKIDNCETIIKKIRAASGTMEDLDIEINSLQIEIEDKVRESL